MNTGLFNADPSGTPKILTVAELNRAVAGLLERSFPLVWVAGEVSNFTRAASGHWYFSLKDRDAQVRCVMFRGRNQGVSWPLTNGDHVEARAIPGLYAARGEFQLTVEHLRRAGAGSLYEAFLRLKEKLAAEGLFEAERKRPLPRFPRVLGLVTSPQAAALRDVLTTLARRAPHVRVVLYPAPVQGADAPAGLCAALERAAARAVRDGIEALLLVRGGGSLEDLIAFNHESVARAIVACPVPVVAGVGHETDFTIADFVADLRAPTPTAAAELASPDRGQWLAELALRRDRLARGQARILREAELRVDDLQRRLKSPAQRAAEVAERLAASGRRLRSALHARLADHIHALSLLAARLRHERPDPALAAQRTAAARDRLAGALRATLRQREARLDLLATRLTLLDPTNILTRGYAIASAADGTVVRDAAELQPGQALRVVLARGAALTEVRAVEPVAADPVNPDGSS